MVDFKNFKKVAEDEHVATMANDKGHKIHINKSVLSPALRTQLAALPLHQSDPQDEVPEVAPNMTGIDAAKQVLANNPPASPSDADISALEAPQADSAPSPTPDAPAAPVDPLAAYKQVPGFNQELQGIQGTQNALSTQGKAVAEAEHNSQVQQEQLQHAMQRDLADKQTEIDAVTDDIRNGHIAPRHYLDSMSTGSKISTAIGLLLGGISSGMTGQPNPVLGYLNKQIENDLEGQKADMANKHNLLSSLQRQYGDIGVASNMYSAIRSKLLASQVAEAAGNSQSAMAKAAGQSATGALLQQSGQFLQQAQLAHMKATVTGSQQAPPATVDNKAQQYLQAARVLDPRGAEEFEKRYIPGVGVANVPLEPKDRELIQKKTELNDLLKRAQDTLTSTGLGTLPLTAKHEEAKSIQNQLTLKMGELADLSRFTPAEAAIYRQTVPDISGTHITGKDQTLLQGLRDSNDSSLNTFYQQKGINRQAGDAETVKVLHPNGQSGNIPRAQVQKAIKAGFKVLQ